MNTKDFGAVGDGRTDDTSAIQAAIDAAEAGGRVVYFPRGRYIVRTLSVKSGLTLMGNSAWGYVQREIAPPGRAADPEGAGNTVLMPAEGAQDPLILGEHVHRIRLVGLGLEGADKGENLTAIAFRHSSAITLEDVRASGFTGTAVQLHQVQGFALRKCLFIRNGGHALDASGSQNGMVMDCQLSYNKGAGFNAAGGEMAGFSILSNRIEGGHPGGVYVENAQGIIVDGNSFDTTLGPAVTLLGCTGGAITGNMARLSGHDQTGAEDSHMRFEKCCGISITGNAFWGWPQLSTNPWSALYGIYGADLTDCIIAQNTMFDACRKALIHTTGTHHRLSIQDNAGQVIPWAPPAAK